MSFNHSTSVSPWTILLGWINGYNRDASHSDQEPRGVVWLRTIPFVAMDLAVMTLFSFVWIPVAVWPAVFFYTLRMFAITSLAHRFGHRPYDIQDGSRSHFLLPLITFGGSWRNNHHFYPSSARQRFCWWELDVTYYIFRVLQILGLLGDVRPLPARVLNPNATIRKANL